MTDDEALDIVCDTAWAWAQEYGFSPYLREQAETVWAAAKQLRPEREPQP